MFANVIFCDITCVQVSQTDNYFPAKSAERRAGLVPAHKQCPNLLKICRTLSLHLAEDGVAILKIFKIRVKLMYRHFSWLEVETTLSFGGFAIAKVETT